MSTFNHSRLPEPVSYVMNQDNCYGIRSERRLCEEAKLNLAYRWFCRLSIEDKVPNHSIFSKNCHGRFRESEALRLLFEQTVERCIAQGMVGGGRWVKALLSMPVLSQRMPTSMRRSSRKMTMIGLDQAGRVVLYASILMRWMKELSRVNACPQPILVHRGQPRQGGSSVLCLLNQRPDRCRCRDHC